MSGKSRDKNKKKKNANRQNTSDFDTFQDSLNAFMTEEKQAESEIDTLLESSERSLRENLGVDFAELDTDGSPGIISEPTRNPQPPPSAPNPNAFDAERSAENQRPPQSGVRISMQNQQPQIAQTPAPRPRPSQAQIQAARDQAARRAQMQSMQQNPNPVNSVSENSAPKQPLSSFQMAGSPQPLSVKQDISVAQSEEPQESQISSAPLEEPQASQVFPLTRNVSPAAPTPRTELHNGTNPVRLEENSQRKTILNDLKPEIFEREDRETAFSEMPRRSIQPSNGPSIILENHDPTAEENEAPLNSGNAEETPVHNTIPENEDAETMENAETPPEIEKRTFSQKIGSFLSGIFRPFSKSSGPPPVENEDSPDHGVNEEIAQQNISSQPNETAVVSSEPQVDLIEETARQTQKIHAAHETQAQTPHTLQEDENRTQTQPANDDHLLANDDDDFEEDDDDDFEAAVRQARRKLISAGAMVLLCAVAFFAWHSISPYVFRTDEIAVEQPESDTDLLGERNGFELIESQYENEAEEPQFPGIHTAGLEYTSPQGIDLSDDNPSEFQNDNYPQLDDQNMAPQPLVDQFAAASQPSHDANHFDDAELDTGFADLSENRNENTDPWNQNAGEEISSNDTITAQPPIENEPIPDADSYGVVDAPFPDLTPQSDSLADAPQNELPQWDAQEPLNLEPDFGAYDDTVPLQEPTFSDAPPSPSVAQNFSEPNHVPEPNMTPNNFGQEEPYLDAADVQPVVPNHLSLHSSAPPVMPTAPPALPAPQEPEFRPELTQPQRDSSPAHELAQHEQRPVLHGETQGARITVPQMSDQKLPLPNRFAADNAVQSTPAAPLASQYDTELGGVAAPQPTFAMPGLKYEEDPPEIPEPVGSIAHTAPPIAVPLNLDALNVPPAAPPVPQPVLQPGPIVLNESRSQTLADAGTYPPPLQTPNIQVNNNNPRRIGRIQRPAQNYAQQYSEPGDTAPVENDSLSDEQYLRQPSRPTMQQVSQQNAPQFEQPILQNPQNAQNGSYRTYVVQEGDNLFNIAKRELGSVARWKQLYQINRDTIGQDARRLVPGTKIMIP